MNIFTIILLVEILIIFRSNWRGLNYKNGILLNTFISPQVKDDEEVLKIISKAKKRFLVALLAGIFLSLLNPILGEFKILHFILMHYIFLVLIYIAVNEPFHELRSLKLKNNWCSNSNTFSVDTKLSLIGERLRFNPYLYILPSLIVILAITYTIKNLGLSESFAIEVIGIMTIVANLILQNLYRNLRTKAFTGDENKDIKLNRILKYDISRLIFMFFTLESILISIFSFLYVRSFNSLNYSETFASTHENFINIKLSILIFFVFYTILILGEVFMIRSKTSIFDGLLVDRYSDEDMYYDLLGYKNPNNPKLFVPSMRGGNYDVNRGILKGKIFISVQFLILILLIFLASSSSLYKDSFNIKYLENSISIGAFPYSSKIDFSKIEDIKLLDELPGKITLRTNGAGLSDKNYGEFIMEGIGKVRLYIFNNGPYIEILNDDKIIFLNAKNPEMTREIYKNLKRKINQGG